MAILAAAAALSTVSARQFPNQGYTLVSSDGVRTLVTRTAGSVDVLSLDQLVPLFSLTVREDALAGGVSITAAKQTIVLTPNQPYASVGGRLVSLSAPITRDGKSWTVPLDLLSRAIGPALGERIEIRRASRLVVVGDVRVPQLTARVDRQSTGARITIDVAPPTTYHVAREATRVVVKFDAAALDLTPTAGLPADVVAGIRVDGTALVIDLGPAAANAQAAEDAAGAHVTIDLATAPANAPAAKPPDAPVPVIPLQPTAGIRTIVIDPGHGGADSGVRAADGLAEKDLALTIARRLKSVIEERLGLHVLLTRDGDDDVPIDKRSALANNNKADLFISLHADASWRATARGAQILSLNPDDYRDQLGNELATGVAVPVIGGGTRTIATMPWDLAQIPHAVDSTTFAGIVDRLLREHSVPMHNPSLVTAPLRVLVGANMPAVLIELGFLSNADDARALSGGDLPEAVVEALLAAITEVRNGIPSAPGGTT